ncbi:MAG: hypothetical protein WA872_19565 [Candidatus Sulfotelmatobacter sp.]
MNFNLKARINRSAAGTIRQALGQLAAKGSVRKEGDEFIVQAEMGAGLTHALAGLWWDAKGDWKRAHESAQQDEGKGGSWVHA